MFPKLSTASLKDPFLFLKFLSQPHPHLLTPDPSPIKPKSAHNLSRSSPCHSINVITALSSFQPSLAPDHRELPSREAKMDSQRLERPLSRYTGAKTRRRGEIKQNNDSWCLHFSVSPEESVPVSDTVTGPQSYL